MRRAPSCGERRTAMLPRTRQTPAHCRSVPALNSKTPQAPPVCMQKVYTGGFSFAQLLSERSLTRAGIPSWFPNTGRAVSFCFQNPHSRPKKLQLRTLTLSKHPRSPSRMPQDCVSGPRWTLGTLEHQRRLKRILGGVVVFRATNSKRPTPGYSVGPCGGVF